ncbi:MAG: fused MFS/spermidine synthase [Coriobacteriales bacterium]
MTLVIVICAGLVAVAAIAVAAVVLVRRYRRSREIFLKFDTMAGPCRVFTIERKDGLVRVMSVAGTMQSATYLDDDTYCDLAYSYTRDYDCMFFAGVPVRDVLVLGGGGYSYPKHLIAHHPETFVTCVEIDPVITAIACRYFFLDRLFEEYDLDENGRLQLVEGDARAFLEGSTERYDAIVNDCFSGMSLVDSLVTREAARLYHEHLREGGIYLANVIGAVEGPRSRTMRRILRTLASEFAHVYVLPGQPDVLSNCDNNVVIATDGDWRFAGAIMLEAWELADAELLLDENAREENWTVPTGA